jgi:hypothetical protein
VSDYIQETLPVEDWPAAQEVMLDALAVMEEVVLTAESAGGLSISGWSAGDVMIDDSDGAAPVLVVVVDVDWGV